MLLCIVLYRVFILSVHFTFLDPLKAFLESLESRLVGFVIILLSLQHFILS